MMTAYHSCEPRQIQMSAAAIMQLVHNIQGMFPK